MFSRVFGRPKHISSASAIYNKDVNDDFVVVGRPSLPTLPPAALYTLEGATVFQHDCDGRRASEGSGAVQSVDDPVQGVPFRLTVSISPDMAGTDFLTEAIDVVNKMKNRDWDAYEYDFQLEHSVLDECSSKIEQILLREMGGL